MTSFGYNVLGFGAFTTSAAIEFYGWGRNQLGQVGIGSVLATSSPVQIADDGVAWASVTNSSQYRTFATKTDGTMWSWGAGNFGLSGKSDAVARSVPSQIGALTTWATVNGGHRVCMAVKTDNTLWAWGDGGDGRLGDSNGANHAISSPVQIGDLTDWSSVKVGTNVCIAIKTDGTMWSWGLKNNGKLGQGALVDISSPVQIGALTTWATQDAGGEHCGCIKTDGTLWTWGKNNDGQLGDGTVRSRSSPVQITDDTNWASLALGDTFSVAIKTDGTMWTWGGYTSGKLGQSVADGAGLAKISSPTQLGDLTTWSQLSLDFEASSCAAVKTDGTLWVWGYTNFGRLGLSGVGTATSGISSPVQLGDTTDWVFTHSSNFDKWALTG